MATTRAKTTGEKLAPGHKAKGTARAAKAEAVAKAPPQEDKGDDASDQGAGMLRLRMIVAAAAERSGRKRTEVRPVVEAVLALIGEALAAGQGINVPGLGKITVKRTSDGPGGQMIALRMRRKKTPDAQEPLAEDSEGS